MAGRAMGVVRRPSRDASGTFFVAGEMHSGFAPEAVKQLAAILDGAKGHHWFWPD